MSGIGTLFLAFLAGMYHVTRDVLVASAVADAVLGVTIAAVGLLPLIKSLKGTIPDTRGERVGRLVYSTIGLGLLGVAIVRGALGV